MSLGAAQCVHVFQEWLELPDFSALLLLLATIEANRVEGDDPVWPPIIGPPGGGKTEMLNAAVGLPDIHPAATLTEAALLSGTSKKESAAGAKGGLLREIGDFGIVLCKDFGSVLSMHRDARSSLLAALREVYDGSWTRHVGTDGGRTLSWSGKIGLIVGCTPAIDSHHAVMGSMGERFVLFRLPSVDADKQARRALSHAGRERKMRTELAERSRLRSTTSTRTCDGSATTNGSCGSRRSRFAAAPQSSVTGTHERSSASPTPKRPAASRWSCAASSTGSR